MHSTDILHRLCIALEDKLSQILIRLFCNHFQDPSYSHVVFRVIFVFIHRMMKQSFQDFFFLFSAPLLWLLRILDLSATLFKMKMKKSFCFEIKAMMTTPVFSKRFNEIWELMLPKMKSRSTFNSVLKVLKNTTQKTVEVFQKFNSIYFLERITLNFSPLFPFTSMKNLISQHAEENQCVCCCA